MPYTQRLNTASSISKQDAFQLNLELNSLRQELDEVRAAYMSLRALLVAATVVGAGYNTVATDLGATTPNVAVPARRFTSV